MKWIEVRAEYEERKDRLVSELVADAFFETGLSGVAVYDGRIQETDDWAEGAGPDAGPPHVDGYFPEDHRWPKRLADLESRLAELKKRTGIRVALEHRRRDESEWAEAWKWHFHPMRIGDRFVVKPSWRWYPARPEDVIVEIDPGMAFGTGSHATTALCMMLLEKYVKGGEAFMDVGTGSGILMIAAAKLGAKRLAGVDREPTAMEVARANLVRNGIDPARFQLFVGNLLEGVSGSFDLVAANIITDAVVALVPQLPGVLRPGGIFICSGMIEKNTHRVEKEMKTYGLTILEMPAKDGWVAIAATR